VGKACGDDGCGGSCGDCLTDETCTAGICESNCVPKTCTSLGKECGDDWSDECGGILSCGECTLPEICNSQGICDLDCVPKTCTSLGKECGDDWSDECGGILSCGDCLTDETCNAGFCEIPKTGFCENLLDSNGPGVKPRTRIFHDDINKYCDPFTLEYFPTLGKDNFCENNYECDSNLCLDGVCNSVQRIFDVHITLLERIYCGSRYLLSGKQAREECMYGTFCEVDGDCEGSEVCDRGLCLVIN